MSITLSNRDYAVTFTDDCDIDFNNPLAGSQLNVSLYGELDTLTRPYKVQLDRKSHVEAQLGRLKGTKDFEYAGMALMSWTAREDGPFAAFNVVFKGCHNNQLPLPKVSGGFSRGQISVPFEDVRDFPGLPGLSTLSGTTATLIYRGPFTTYKYCSRSVPVKPQFPGTVPVGAIEIDERQGAQANDVVVFPLSRLLNGAPAERDLQSGGAFRVFEYVEIDGPTYEQVGLYYECTETYRSVLRQVTLESRLRRLGSVS